MMYLFTYNLQKRQRNQRCFFLFDDNQNDDKLRKKKKGKKMLRLVINHREETFLLTGEIRFTFFQERGHTFLSISLRKKISID